ncbi:MAG TPA: T9SS type A sorting domain-containing protein, partial [Bacteroidales bacterium]|nr:T9SS type A sorting domain-containing protein [Bacteroidales bacterium]
NPGIGGVIRLGNALAVHFGWEFMPDPDHVLPVAFKVFAAADTNSAYWTTPVGFVNYEPGITSYSLDLLDSPNFDYSFMVPNYWKVVPTTALPAGLDALNVQTWNFHFDEYLGVGDISMNRSFISPNPAKEHVFVNLPPDSKSTIRLLSANGKELQTLSTNERIQVIDLKNQRNGIYYVRVENGKSIEMHKLIISR